MAYPPPVPPANRVNATPQFDNHPGDHNAISSALSDMVNVLGATPQGAYSSVQTRFENLEQLRGAGVWTSGQLYNSNQTANLTWTDEAYDYGGFHAPGSTALVVPPNLDGIYLIGVKVNASVPVNGPCDVDIYLGGSLLGIGYLPASKQSISVQAGPFPLSAGSSITVSVYNGHTAQVFFSGSIDMLLARRTA